MYALENCLISGIFFFSLPLSMFHLQSFIIFCFPFIQFTYVYACKTIVPMNLIFFCFVQIHFCFTCINRDGLLFFIVSISFIQNNLLFPLACSKWHFSPSAHSHLVCRRIRSAIESQIFLCAFLFSVCLSSFLCYYLVMLLLCNAFPIFL